MLLSTTTENLGATDMNQCPLANQLKKKGKKKAVEDNQTGV